jgi:hypothetical protein
LALVLVLALELLGLVLPGLEPLMLPLAVPDVLRVPLVVPVPVLAVELRSAVVPDVPLIEPEAVPDVLRVLVPVVLVAATLESSSRSVRALISARRA